MQDIDFEGISRKCLICNSGKKNDTLYYNLSIPELTEGDTPVDHILREPFSFTVYCCKCGKNYTMKYYCDKVGIIFSDLLKNNLQNLKSGTASTGASDKELHSMEYPSHFFSIMNPASKPAIEYLRGRGIVKNLSGFAFDSKLKGAAFCYYYFSDFCGAQTRFFSPPKDFSKITTLTGTKRGKLFWGWNQSFAELEGIKRIVVTEGALDAASLREMGIEDTLFIALSGSNLSTHHINTLLKANKECGIEIIISPDNDDAGAALYSKSFKKLTKDQISPPEGFKDWNQFLMERPKDMREAFEQSMRSRS